MAIDKEKGEIGGVYLKTLGLVVALASLLWGVTLLR